MATERGLGFGLSEAEAAEVQRRVRGGETHAAAAAQVGCREDRAAVAMPYGWN